MRIVGAKDEAARVQLLLCDRLDLCCHIVPGRTVAQHGFHSLPHTGNRILHPRAFVVVFRPASHITVKRQTQIKRRIMPADGFASRVGDAHFIEHLFVA